MLEVLSLNCDLQNKVREEEKMLSARWDQLPSYEIGLEKGFEKGIEEVVIKMLPIFDDQKISEYTGISTAVIKK